MARLSVTFGLSNSQAELDFIDVDTATDTPLFVDPYAIQIRDDEWSSMCSDYIRSFFNEVLDALRAGNNAHAEHFMSQLHEPNETCLGVSTGNPQGRGVGEEKARDLSAALANSRAFKTGLLSDVSEAELFIRGVGPDTISDLTTNVLRGPLAKYTVEQCELHEIPIQQTSSLGPIWDPGILDWRAVPLNLPHVNGRPILFVPKFSVRHRMSLNSQEFYNHQMVNYLQSEYLQAGGALVQTFKNGSRRVTKKSVKEKHPFIKDDLATFVIQHPEILAAYKQLKGAQGALENNDIEEDFDERAFAQVLAKRLRDIPGGNDDASTYHSVMLGICTFLFYPNLICPIKENEIHQGRKRIDIKFTNAARDGFFYRMIASAQARAISIPVECKNYTKKIANPELDQIQGRFGHQRGFFGILLCRDMDNRDRIVEGCRDTANDRRGYILVFEDADIYSMLSSIENGNRREIDRFLQDRFDEITH